jgi:GT2 family glycosyltransferase
MTGSPRDDAPAAPAQPGRTGVVLVNHDSADDTVGCVASLEASRDLDLDIVVVDNSDSPASADALRTLLGDRAEVISSGGNLGYAGGSNVGIARCLERGNQFVWLLNPDTRVERDTLPRLLEVLDDVPDCGVVGPRIVHPGEPALIWFDGGIVDEAKHGETRHVHQNVPLDDAPPARRIDVDYVTGA